MMRNQQLHDIVDQTMLTFPIIIFRLIGLSYRLMNAIHITMLPCKGIVHDSKAEIADWQL